MKKDNEDDGFVLSLFACCFIGALTFALFFLTIAIGYWFAKEPGAVIGAVIGLLVVILAIINSSGENKNENHT